MDEKRKFTRRDFLKYSGTVGAYFWGMNGGSVMANRMSRVVLLKTENRSEGVKKSLDALGMNPCRGKDVLIKPNFNTADLTPGSTHNDTLIGLVEKVWEMGGQINQPGGEELSSHPRSHGGEGDLTPAGKKGRAGHQL